MTSKAHGPWGDHEFSTRKHPHQPKVCRHWPGHHHRDKTEVRAKRSPHAHTRPHTPCPHRPWPGPRAARQWIHHSLAPLFPLLSHGRVRFKCGVPFWRTSFLGMGEGCEGCLVDCARNWCAKNMDQPAVLAAREVHASTVSRTKRYETRRVQEGSEGRYQPALRFFASVLLCFFAPLAPCSAVSWACACVGVAAIVLVWSASVFFLSFFFFVFARCPRRPPEKSSLDED